MKFKTFRVLYLLSMGVAAGYLAWHAMDKPTDELIESGANPLVIGYGMGGVSVAAGAVVVGILGQVV